MEPSGEEEDHIELKGARTITAEAVVSGKTAIVEDTLDLERKATPFSVYWPVSESGNSSLQIRYGSDNLNGPKSNAEPGEYKQFGDFADDENGKGAMLRACLVSGQKQTDKGK